MTMSWWAPFREGVHPPQTEHTQLRKPRSRLGELSGISPPFILIYLPSYLLCNFSLPCLSILPLFFQTSSSTSFSISCPRLSYQFCFFPLFLPVLLSPHFLPHCFLADCFCTQRTTPVTAPKPLVPLERVRAPPLYLFSVSGSFNIQ